MVSIPANFNLVAGVVGASFIVHHIYMPFNVAKARKKYQIKYPDLYATNDNCKNDEHRKTFNCVQRAHQNSLENQPAFLAMLLTAGLQYPIMASVLGCIYVVGKVLYFAGYSSGDPEKRLQGVPAYIGSLGLLGTCVTLGVRALIALVTKS